MAESEQAGPRTDRPLERLRLERSALADPEDPQAGARAQAKLLPGKEI